MEDKNELHDDNEVTKEIEEGITSPGTQKKYLIGILLVIVALVAVWVAKSNEVNYVKAENEKSNTLLRRQAKKEVVHSHEEHIKLLAKPLVWALGAQLENGNLKQAERYIDDIVTEDNFQLIAVVDATGTVILSTNKQFKGKPFATVGKASLLDSKFTKLENVQDKMLLMASPITGKSGRIGTLYIQYKLAPKP